MSLRSFLVYLLIISSVSVASGKKIIIDRQIREGEFIDRTDIEEVTFREGTEIREIPDYAFLGCTSLRRVDLPKGLEKIGYQAFSECSALEEVTFPMSLSDIGSNAFAYCSKLDGIIFPDSLRHIGHNAFSFCESLRSVYLPDGVEEIESYAFSDCTSLEKVRLPANGNMLGELLFNCCSSLTEITAPSMTVAPIDCQSYLFDPEDTKAYGRCVLKVPVSQINNYNVSKSWQMFNKNAIGDE